LQYIIQHAPPRVARRLRWSKTSDSVKALEKRGSHEVDGAPRGAGVANDAMRVLSPRGRQFLCGHRKPRYACFIACEGSKRRRPPEFSLQRGCQGIAGQIVEIAESAVKQSLDEP
jgi:hypothetical protein